MKSEKEKPYKYLAMISQIGISVLVPVGILAGLRNMYVIPLRMSERAQKIAAENMTDEERAAEKKRAQEYRDQIKKENEDDENDADL